MCVILHGHCSIYYSVYVRTRCGNIRSWSVCVCVCGCAYKFHSQFHAVVANINIGKSPLSVYTIKTDSELKSCYGEGSTP